MPGQRQHAGAQGGPDDLVDRVVTSDVLADQHRRAPGIEEARGVQSTGPVEDALAVTQPVGEFGHEVRLEYEWILIDRPGHRRPYVGDAVRAAHATRARRRERSRGRRFDTGSEHHFDGVVLVRAQPHACELRYVLDGRFTDQPARDQVEVVAWRAHGHRQRHPADAHHERLLDRQRVGTLAHPVIAQPQHRSAGRLLSHGSSLPCFGRRT